jgi:hypothetical protein
MECLGVNKIMLTKQMECLIAGVACVALFILVTLFFMGYVYGYMFYIPLVIAIGVIGYLSANEWLNTLLPDSKLLDKISMLLFLVLFLGGFAILAYFTKGWFVIIVGLLVILCDLDKGE